MQFEDINYLPENLASVMAAYKNEFEKTMQAVHEHVRNGTQLWYSQYYFGGGLICTPYSIAVAYTKPNGKAVTVGILPFHYTNQLAKLDKVNVAKNIRILLNESELEMVQNIELFMSTNMELVFKPNDSLFNAVDLTGSIMKHLDETERLVSGGLGGDPEKIKQAEIFNRVNRARTMRSLPKMISDEINGF